VWAKRVLSTLLPGVFLRPTARSTLGRRLGWSGRGPRPAYVRRPVGRGRLRPLALVPGVRRRRVLCPRLPAARASPSGRPALGTLRCRVDHKATNITEANDSPTGLTESVDEDLLTRQVVPVYSVPVAAPKRWRNPGLLILLQFLSLFTREETGHPFQDFPLLLRFSLVIIQIVVIDVDDSSVGRLRSRGFPVPSRLTSTGRTGTLAGSGSRSFGPGPVVRRCLYIGGFCAPELVPWPPVSGAALY